MILAAQMARFRLRAGLRDNNVAAVYRLTLWVSSLPASD